MGSIDSDMLVITRNDILELGIGVSTPTHRCPISAWAHRGHSSPTPTLVIGDNPYIYRRSSGGKPQCCWCDAAVTDELEEFLDTGDHKFYWEGRRNV